MIHRLLWSLVDTAFRFLARVNLAFTLRSATHLGQLAARVGIFGIRPRQIGDLYGIDSPADRASIARKASGCALVRRVVARTISIRGIDVLSPLVERETIAALREILARGRGVILATVHAGSIPALSEWLELSGVEYAAFQNNVLVRSRDRRGPAPTFVAERVVGMRATLEHLHAGRAVCIAIDAVGAGGRFTLDYLGRRVRFMPGVPALARSSGAPIHAVLAFWDVDTSTFRVNLSDEIGTDDLDADDPDAFDRSVLERLAAHFEALMRQRPELLAFEIERLLEQPPSEDGRLLEPA